MTTHEAGGGGSAIDPLMAPDSDDDENRMDLAAMREATEEYGRPATDGGSVEVKAADSVGGGATVENLIETFLTSMSTTQKLAAGVGGLVLLAAISGDDAAAGGRDDSKVSCPECGEKKSKRGMMGHLQWSHDLDADQLDDAKAKAGIGQ